MDAEIQSQKQCISCAYFYENKDAHKIDTSRCFDCARANLSGGDYLPNWEPVVFHKAPEVEDLLEAIRDLQREVYKLKAERDAAEELVEKFVKVYTSKLPQDLADPISKVGGYY